MSTANSIPHSQGVAGPLAQGIGRLNSVDLLRGLIMVIMALDHTREYFTHLRFDPEDIRFTYAALFFTRWITHFCAPVFFFLAGTGAYLSRKTGAELSRFLWTRGLWLIFLELAFTSFEFTFAFNPVVILLVLWALGWCMIALAVLVRLPLKWMTVISVTMIAVHNAFDTVAPATFGKMSWLWLVLHQKGFIPLTGTAGLFVAYPLVPWIGVMGAGYALGSVLKQPAEKRRNTLLWLGVAMTLAFIVLRATNVWGHQPEQRAFPSEGLFHVQPSVSLTLIDFLDTQKYPPSLQFLLMTLGPALLLLVWFEKVDLKKGFGLFWDKVLIYGRVPLFYYLLHIMLIHMMAIISALIFRQPAAWLWNGGYFAGPRPQGYGHNLPYIYLMWLSAVVILYVPCRWYARVKATHKDWWWLSYL